MKYTLNLREVTYALSEALDYVGIDDTMHGKRVAYMASVIGKRLGWVQERVNRISMIGMLHDCGVSSSDVHHHLVTELDWDNSHVHCLRGAALMEKVPVYEAYSSVIFYHHTHWDQFDSSVDLGVKEDANMIYLADRIDALRVQLGFHTLKEREAVCAMIQKYSGTMFCPQFVDAFLELSRSDSFWFYMEPESLGEYFSEWIQSGEDEIFSYGLLKNIAMMFADVVDAKSTFTAEHTYGVASVARYIAQVHGLNFQSQETVELAAFFHDLGKLRVADAILHKAGPLSDEERTKMRRHGFDSQMILRKIKGFQEIAKIASMHHETIDAKGYPYQLGGDQIPVEARILAIADIFQALVQDRPYRKGLSAEEAVGILDTMVRENKIDGAIVKTVNANLARCYQSAMEPNGS